MPQRARPSDFRTPVAVRWDGTGPQRAGPTEESRDGHQVTRSPLRPGARRAPPSGSRAVPARRSEPLSSAGWARWVKTRALFHAYSAGNRRLLAAQVGAARCRVRRAAPADRRALVIAVAAAELAADRAHRGRVAHAFVTQLRPAVTTATRDQLVLAAPVAATHRRRMVGHRFGGRIRARLGLGTISPAPACAAERRSSRASLERSTGSIRSLGVQETTSALASTETISHQTQSNKPQPQDPRKLRDLSTRRGAEPGSGRFAGSVSDKTGRPARVARRVS
jgi:hypothetical protein